MSVDDNMQSVLVVGYDGSEPAQRALVGAVDMLRGRAGRIEAVFVAHMPTTAAFLAQAVAAMQEGLDNEEHELFAQVDETLRETDVKWHFQRRNGEIAPQLLEVGQEQLDAGGADTHVVLVVGGSAHKIDRYLNSTPARVIRQDRFEVFVVP
jgi:nucleotide-binding universal stress UspA family protein